jgi:hypothetical protein
LGAAARLSGRTGSQPVVLDAVVPSATFEVGQLTLGFSYDVNTSSLARASYLRGGWEVAVGWQFGQDGGCVVCPGL